VKGLNNIEKRMLELAGPGLKFNVLSPEYKLGHRSIWYSNVHIPLSVLHHRQQQEGISIPSLICVLTYFFIHSIQVHGAIAERI
jgi:hypothetical protein